MLETVIVFLMIAWLIGLFFGVAGSMIHLLLAAALMLFAVRLFSGGRIIYDRQKSNLIDKRHFLS